MAGLARLRQKESYRSEVGEGRGLAVRAEAPATPHALVASSGNLRPRSGQRGRRAHRWAAAGCEARRPGKDRARVSSLSIIIPTLNEERHIGALLSEIASQTRAPDEVIVVDAGSEDGTREVVGRYSFAKLLEGEPPVACGRNLGGRSAGGDVLIFLDADARLTETFLEDFLAAFERRRLDVACPLYFPYRSTRPIEVFHIVFNLITRASQGVLPSGGGTCIAVRGEVFRGSSGFDPSLKFDDIEAIRRLSKGRRFGIVEERLYLSDRRYREGGVARTMLQISLMGVLFVFGKYSWANHLDYDINGTHRY